MIADRCQVSFETIKTYIKRIYEKLHVASMTEAVAKALKENLV
jgi:DNA-binding NarL/FixJ family response regulator